MDGTPRVIAEKGGSWSLFLGSDDKLQLRLIHSDVFQSILSSATVIEAGQEYNIAFTSSGYPGASFLRLYVDHRLESAPAGIPAVQTSENPIQFGDNSLREEPYLGEVNNVQASVIVLSSSERAMVNP